METQEIQARKQRIEWLDGWKGILCILIFVHHFCLLFFPAIHYGVNAPSYLQGVDTFLSQSPLSVILNGNYMVALFCVISAVVISRSLIRKQDTHKLVRVVLKRYFRLMLPLFFVGFISFLFLRFGWFTNQQVSEIAQSPWGIQYYKEPISFGTFLKSALVTTWFVGDATLSTSFWMLSDLFLGTFLCALLSVISWKFPKKAWIGYLCAALLFFNKSELALAFVLGTLIAWMSIYAPNSLHKYVGIVAFILGVLLGGFPSGVVPTNFYKFVNFLSYTDWHILGAGLTVYGVFSCRIFQKILSWKPFVFLGKICYSVYLLHIFLLFSFTSSLFLWIYTTMGYLFSVAVCFLISLGVLIAAAFLYQRYAETNLEKLRKAMWKRIDVCLHNKSKSKSTL